MAKLPFPWSKVQHDDQAYYAIDTIYINENKRGLKYHNLDHLYSMYSYLEVSGVPYDEALDWAVLYHDFVYDSAPEKEFRSAEMWKKTARIYNRSEDMIEEVHALIMTTSDHRATTPKSFYLIRADLHQLRAPAQTVVNFYKIMEESINLYTITPEEYARSTLRFMPSLRLSVAYTKSKDDISLVPFYEQAERGISRTVRLANEVLGQSEIL